MRIFFFFKQKTAYEMRISDWSSDVCSSDLFCKQFNAATQKLEPGIATPVVITVYSDRSFTFITKTPPATTLIKKAAGIESGSPTPHTKKVGKITKKQVEEIAKLKMPDLNAGSMEAAMRLIAGSARSIGIEVVEK